jgi:hypothetical protein
MLHYNSEINTKEAKKVNRRHRYRMIAALVSGLLLSSAIIAPAGAAPIFSEDFEDIDLGASSSLVLATNTVGSPFTTIGTGTNYIASINADAASSPFIFGPAAGNQYLSFADGGGGTPYVSAPVSIVDSVFMLTFDFYDPSDSSNSGTRLALSDISNVSSGGGRILDLGFSNGTLLNSNPTGGETVTVYAQAQMNSVTIVGNYTDATYNYTLGGPQSVAAGRFDVFLNGAITPVGNDLAFRKAPVTLIGSTHLGFSGPSNSSTSATYFDNISISIVPEPTSFMLAGISILSVALFRRPSART